MSPGPTFDRVYVALKEQLRSGRHAPGAHLEPSILGEELCSSITPVRDVLHRLVGERLVEAPRNDGFRVPMVTEFALRQLYAWHADLMRLAVARYRAEQQGQVQLPGAEIHGGTRSAVDVFLEFGRASGDVELQSALANVADRLAPVRLLEERFIADLDEEQESFRRSMEPHDPGALRHAITAYHRRRDRTVPQIVAALQRPM